MNILRVFMMFLLCASFVPPVSALAQSEDLTPSTSPTPLTLINGWFNAPYDTSNAEVEKVNDIVHLKGAIATSGNDPEPFVLPEGFRPSKYVYIPVDLCDSTYGQLDIEPSGEVLIQAETSLTDAECFTSLDGASFALNGSGFTALKPINGWTNTLFDVANAGVANIAGIVHFRGGISTKETNAEAFVLPKGFRPAHAVYVPVDLCAATKGRLYIQPNGVVTVQAESSFGYAQCYTSLDGAWFVATDTGFKSLSLMNGWTDGPFDTSSAKVEKANGIVYFQGAIATSGSNTEPFVLPSSFIPHTNVYVPVDLCGATNGRLFIQPNGVVIVQAETTFGDAQCFTSLDGVSFAP